MKMKQRWLTLLGAALLVLASGTVAAPPKGDQGAGIQALATCDKSFGDGGHVSLTINQLPQKAGERDLDLRIVEHPNTVYTVLLAFVDESKPEDSAFYALQHFHDTAHAGGDQSVAHQHMVREDHPTGVKSSDGVSELDAGMHPDLAPTGEDPLMGHPDDLPPKIIKKANEPAYEDMDHDYADDDDHQETYRVAEMRGGGGFRRGGVVAGGHRGGFVAGGRRGGFVAGGRRGGFAVGSSGGGVTGGPVYADPYYGGSSYGTYAPTTYGGSGGGGFVAGGYRRGGFVAGGHRGVAGGFRRGGAAGRRGRW